MKSKHSILHTSGRSCALAVKARPVVLRPQGFSSTLAFTGAHLDYPVFDANYVLGLKDGDPETERHFTSYFSNAIWLKLRNRVRVRHLMEEIRQETFTRVLSYLRSGKTIQHPERFGGFVLAVCNNVMLEVLRSEFTHRQTNEGVVDPPDLRVRFASDMVTEERKRAVREVLSDMPEKDRTLLSMVFLEEDERAEICKRFSVDGNYLRVLVHRAKEKFRETVRRRGLDTILQ